MGLKGGELVIWGPIPLDFSDVRDGTRNLNTCTEAHINRLYAGTGGNNRDKKSHRGPPVFARRGQNGVALAEPPGAEARISPRGPAPAVR